MIYNLHKICKFVFSQLFNIQIGYNQNQLVNVWILYCLHYKMRRLNKNISGKNKIKKNKNRNLVFVIFIDFNSIMCLPFLISFIDYFYLSNIV